MQTSDPSKSPKKAYQVNTRHPLQQQVNIPTNGGGGGGQSPKRPGVAGSGGNLGDTPPQQIQREESKKKSFTSVHGYVLHEILGKGSFGQVFKATKDNRTYAIKMIDKALIRKKNLQKYVNNEVKVMRDLKNPNTVRLFEAFEDKDVLYLVMECCNQGTLFNHILKTKPGETECIRIFAQIMRGFIEIHEKHILHRDLKPSNIFIKDGVFKIADFGLALPKALGSSYCGTSYFMAPEILQKQIHDYKVDLWSMGVILFFMIFREYPFKNSAKLLDEIQQKTIPIFDPYKCLKHPPQKGSSTGVCSPGLLNLFQRIFVIEPTKRISFKELYDLDIFSEFFSQNELRHSSRIYQDLEKKKPEEPSVAAAAAAAGAGTTSADTQDDDDNDEDDDHVDYKQNGEFKEGDHDENQKKKKEKNSSGKKSIDDAANNLAGNKTKASKFKPPIPPHHQQQQQTHQNQQQQQVATVAGNNSPKNGQKISDFTRGTVSLRADSLKSSTKTNGISPLRPDEKKQIHQIELKQFQGQPLSSQQQDQQNIPTVSNSNSNEGSMFDDDDGQFDIDEDEDPQIEVKNIRMLRNKSQRLSYFGPKAFQDQSVIMPKPKPSKNTHRSSGNRPEDDEDTSVPNAPSTFAGQIQSYHSVSLGHNQQQHPHYDMLNVSHGLNNALNIGSNNSISKKQLYNEVNVPIESDYDEDEEQMPNGDVGGDEQLPAARKSLPISFPDNPASTSEESLRKMPFRKAPSLRMNIIDSAVKEKQRKKIIEECEEVFESHVQVYLYEIGIYSILGDTIDSLNVLNLNSSTQSLVNYLLAKLLLFYATRLLTSLQNSKNIFGLAHFEEFTKSAPSQLVVGKISRDIDQWSMKFSLFYYGINHESDIQSDEVRKIVTEELVETDFEKQLKIPTRLVLDLIFKASYKMGRSCQQELQASGILRTSLYILLCMLVNNVFEKTRVKDYLIHYFNDQKNNQPQSLDFVDFSLWTAQANKEKLLNQIHHLVLFVFGERKLNLLQNRK